MIEKEKRGLTIGNFDGVHLGHKKLLKELQFHCQRLNCQPHIFTFSPHPQSYFRPQVHKRLQSEFENFKKLRKLGFDFIHSEIFNSDLAQMSAHDFLDQKVKKILNPSVLVVGYDFKFGVGGEGNWELLQSWSETSGCEVYRSEALLIDGAPVSTSRIKSSIEEKNFNKVSALLGDPYCLCGSIVEGQKIGRTLGFSTANLDRSFLVNQFLPPSGVYCGYANWEDNRVPSVMNVGFKPTVQNSKEISVEVHLLDGNFDLYNKYLNIEFIKFLRDEKKFFSLEELKFQIKKDCDQARSLLTFV